MHPLFAIIVIIGYRQVLTKSMDINMTSAQSVCLRHNFDDHNKPLKVLIYSLVFLKIEYSKLCIIVTQDVTFVIL